MRKNASPSLVSIGLVILGLMAAGCSDDDSPNKPVIPDNPDLFLGQLTQQVDFALPDDGFTGFRLSLNVAPTWSDPPVGWLFKNMLLQSSDVGDSTVFDAGNCGSFAVLANALSNGVDNWIDFDYDFIGQIPYYGGSGAVESTQWVDGVTSGTRPDYAGYEVLRLVLHIDQVTFAVSGPTLTNFTFEARVCTWGRALPD